MYANTTHRKSSDKTIRIGFTIPKSVVNALNQRTINGEKSRFVTEAIVEKIEKEIKNKKTQMLLREYADSGPYDAKLAEDWFVIENESQIKYEANQNSKTSKKR